MFNLFTPGHWHCSAIWRLFSGLFVAMILSVSLTACDLLSTSESDTGEQRTEVYPMYVDDDGNGVNDYVEASGHEASNSAKRRAQNHHQPVGPVPGGHGFVDQDEDGICDYAQNGSATWHGPGFVDENGNGISDHWDPGTRRHERHDGMEYRDRNGNQINDHVEHGTHQGPGHSFVDENDDGICDRAQDGSPTWHGPNFVDTDGNGRCDYWEAGGRGYGHTGGRHGNGGHNM